MIKKILKLIFLLTLLSQCLYAQYSEYEIKAAYLKSITLFVEWPNDYYLDSTFVITVVGDNPFENYLESLAEGTKIHNKTVKINFTNSGYIPKSNIVFISNSKSDQLEEILDRLKNKNTLIVGDTEGFAEKGVHLNFYKKNNNILFEINLEAIEKTNLKISSRLLKLSRIIN